MKSPAFAILLAVVGALTALPALETSMVLRQGGSQNGGNGLYVVVEPGIGTITLYSVEGTNLTKHGSANFIQDMNFDSQYVIGERGDSVYTALRTGSANCKPSVDELLSMLPSKPTAAELEKGLKSYQERARQAEDLFWKEDHAYDGVVRGALGATSLMLCIPCKRAILVYDIQKQDLGPQLAAWRNFAAELYVPQVLASSPTPTELLAHRRRRSRRSRRRRSRTRSRRWPNPAARSRSSRATPGSGSAPPTATSSSTPPISTS